MPRAATRIILTRVAAFVGLCRLYGGCWAGTHGVALGPLRPGLCQSTSGG